jgi:hypothetical protein
MSRGSPVDSSLLGQLYKCPSELADPDPPTPRLRKFHVRELHWSELTGYTHHVTKQKIIGREKKKGS